jgi:hypothetical protein
LENAAQAWCGLAQVVVLEKGNWTPAAELALTEHVGFRDMYELGSLMTTQDAGALSSMMPLSNCT